MVQPSHTYYVEILGFELHNNTGIPDFTMRKDYPLPYCLQLTEASIRAAADEMQKTFPEIARIQIKYELQREIIYKLP